MKRSVLFLILLFIPLILLAPSLSKSVNELKTKRYLVIIEEQRIKEELNRLADYMYYKESARQWWIINNLGYFGGYQFCNNTLMHLGYGHITLNDFKNDPNIFPKELQDEVFFALIKSNDIILKNYYGFIGSTIKDVIITKSGLLAAAHLAGVGNVILYLTSKGMINKSDIYGTSVKDYIKDFQGFNI
jgi:hypothetical protein